MLNSGYAPSKITDICQNCQILPDVPAKVFKWKFRLFFYHHPPSRLNVTFADNNSFFCNAARSRSIVLCVTDKTSDIISALSTNNNETRGSSYYVEDGSFLKLRNIQLGYNVPKAFANKLAATPSAKQPPSPNPPGAKVTNYINKAISSSRQSNLTLPSS